MARNNFVFLKGKVAWDVKTQKFQSGTMKISFKLNAIRDKKSNNDSVQSDSPNCIAWGKTAEKYKDLKKGDLVAVIGTIQTGSYDKDNKKVYTTDVLIDDVFLTSVSKPASNTGDDIFGDSDEGFEPIDDDLPFA